MLQKLRSRHPIDLPTEGFGHKKPILAILGGLFVLFVLLPFLLSPLAAAWLGMQDGQRIPNAVIGIAAAFGLLALVLGVGTLRGKTGWDRR